MRWQIFPLALTLAGCATVSVEQLNAVIARGDCSGAEAMIQPHAQRGDSTAVNNLGVVAENCRRDRATAVNYYTLSARMGNPTARMNLTRLGREVPAADLIRQSSYDPAAMALGLRLLESGRTPAPPRSPSVNCTTTTNPHNNTSQTTCY